MKGRRFVCERAAVKRGQLAGGSAVRINAQVSGPLCCTMASSALASRAALGSALAFGGCSVAYRPSNNQAALPVRRTSKYGSSGSSLLAAKTSSAFLDGGASSQALVVPSKGVQGEHRSQGGALVVEANLFGRIVRIVKSYANAVVSSAEDPEKLLDQTVIEMGEDLAKMRQASAQVRLQSC